MGRYGMLAIAVLAAVLAVGTFLSWAYANGYLSLSPTLRVVVGVAAATALGAWGIRLRRRERGFGSTILGLALVIVQVCAYAAGPEFQLVPTWLAFAGVAIISWAIALLAHHENDEPLWCVGFGGAALAPFVTSNGSGTVYALLVYGVAILLPACFAISKRDWPIAWRVFYAVTALFGLVGADLGYRAGIVASLCAFAFPFVIITGGIVPFAPETRKRAALRWLGLIAAFASFRTHVLPDTRAVGVAAMLLGGLALWLFLIDRHAHVRQTSLLARTRESPRLLNWIDAAFVPLIIVLSAGTALRAFESPLAAWVVGTVLLVVFVWRRSVTSLRSAAAFAACLCASGALAIAPLERPLGRITAFAALALVEMIVAHRAKPSVSWLVAGVATLIACAGASASALLDRTPYVAFPFTTEPSATALVVLIALICVARFWMTLRVATRAAFADRSEASYATRAKLFVRGVNAAPWVWGFVWGAIELGMAFSASTATLLLVTYFAAVAVACVGVGRARRSARLRRLGLALALVATATAFYGATTYFDIAARILAYLVTSAFLLGIAYRYRQTGGPELRHDAAA